MNSKQTNKALDQARDTLSARQDDLARARAALADHAAAVQQQELALARELGNGALTNTAEDALARLYARKRGLELRLADCEAAADKAERAAIRAEHQHRAAVALEAGQERAAAAARLEEVRREYQAKLADLDAEFRAASIIERNFLHWSGQEVNRLRDAGWSPDDLRELQQEATLATNTPGIR